MRPHLKAFVAAVVLVYFAGNFGMLNKENRILQVKIMKNRIYSWLEKTM